MFANFDYQKKDDVERKYRVAAAPDLLKFRVAVGESDLMVLTSQDLRSEVTTRLKILRRQLKEYIDQHPEFQETLEPYPEDEKAPELIKWMIEVAAKAGVGPMASVAGAIAGMIGQEIDSGITELIIENGGDIYLRSTRERIVAIYAGKSIFSNQIGLAITPQPNGLGICASAGTVGPSLSFGRADAVAIISPDVALADAVATAAGNLIKETGDLPKVIDFTKKIGGIMGALFIIDDQMAVWGDLQIVPLKK